MISALRNRSEYFWLGAILTLALVLRIVGLNGPLWYDEIQTIITHLRLPWGAMMQDYSMNHHYLFNLQSKFSAEIFGESAWSVRLPAVLFGVAAIGAMWFLARDVANTKIAHVTALLLALSYHHIWFSQNARGYTELAFWGTVATLMFLRGIAAPTAKIWLGYGLVAALAMFTHLTGAFLIAAHGLVLLGVWVFASIQGRMSRNLILMPFIGFLAAGLITILLYAPILPSMFEVVGEVSGTSEIDVMQEYQNPLWTIYEGVRTVVGSAGPIVGIIAILVIGLTVIGGVAARRNSPAFGPVVAVHIGLTLILLVALGMRVWPRFFFIDIGFLMLLIVLGVQAVCGWISSISALKNARFNLFTIATLAMVCISVLLATRNYTGPKQNLIGAVEYVNSIRQPGETVLAIGHAGVVFTDYFAADWTSVMDEQTYIDAMAPDGPAIVVVAFPGRSFRAFPQMDADTDIDLKLLRKFPGTLGDGNVLVFRRD